MKLSDFLKVGALLKEHGALSTVESTVASATEKVGNLAIGDSLKAKFASALSGVIDGERARIKSDIEALGVEVDGELKKVVASFESKLGAFFEGKPMPAPSKGESAPAAPGVPGPKPAFEAFVARPAAEG